MTLARDLDRLERSPLNHLRLGMLGVVLRAVELVEGRDEILDQNPFLAEYLGDVGRLTFGRVPSAGQWRAAVAHWSRGYQELPLERLKEAGLHDLAIDVLLALGLAEEDVRLAALFGEGSRLTLGALVALCRSAAEDGHGHAAVGEIERLCAFGLVALHNPDVPRHAREYAVAPAVWDVLSGSLRTPPGIVLTALADLPDGTAFIPPCSPFPSVQSIAAMARERELTLCLRGPRHNGRHMLAGCVMRSLGKPLLSIDPKHIADPAEWSAAGAFACMTGAGAVLELELGPGTDQVLPVFPFGRPLLIVIAGGSGGIQSGDGRPVVAIEVPPPEPAARAALWKSAAGIPRPFADELAQRFRLTSGNIVTAGSSAAIRADLSGASAIELKHVEVAVRGLHDSRLEAVARRVEPLAEADFIALDDVAAIELGALATRCRHRERLNHNGHPQAAGCVGVRALFAGPSGTGKTLCARWLGQQLGKDIFRLDLAASVSKYIGETEKVLDRAFAAAEDLDCILLIDEGDALMARRTDVGSANDRYANLETNFLLQRIESFDGILIVTTNAAERIDKAFSRRMDIVVQFRPPDEVMRYEILERHLGEHAASDPLLQEIACRCALTGGQLRNVAQHARLLALDRDAAIDDDQLRAALAREYRKIEAHCPVKPPVMAAG
jgi:hypothetical protein